MRKASFCINEIYAEMKQVAATPWTGYFEIATCSHQKFFVQAFA